MKERFSFMFKLPPSSLQLPATSSARKLLRLGFGRLRGEVFVHILLHVVADNGDGLDRLVVIHGDANDVVPEAERMAADIEPSKHIVGLAEELLNKGDIGILRARLDGENDLHAGAELRVGDKCTVEALRRVDEVVQEV